MSLPEKIKNVIGSVRDDHTSGSAALQRSLEEGLLSALEGEEDLSVAELKEMRHLLEKLKEGMKHFAVLGHFLRYLLEKMSVSGKGSAAALFEAVLEYREEWMDVNDRIFENFMAHFPVTGDIADMEDQYYYLAPGYSVFLHSQSASVQAFFRLLRKRTGLTDLHIYQTESRPLLEGRQQALYLRDLGYRVTMINEAAASLVIGYCDVVFLGADTVYPTSFTNKIGSYPIALLAKAVEASVMVLADSRKFTDPGEERIPPVPEAPPGEIWPGAPKGIEVKNYYFEEVPAELVTAFITEETVIIGDRPKDDLTWFRN